MSGISINGFADAVKDILEEYEDDAKEIIESVVKDVAKNASRELRKPDTGKFKNRTGAYRRSWQSKTAKTTIGVEAVVYAQAPEYRLTHLLEYGHALKRGGRTVGEVEAFPHISGVNDWAQEEAEKRIREELEK